MSSIISRALRGDRNALITLFDTYKQSVFYVSQAILRNESSISVTQRSMKGAVKALMDGEISSEEDFSLFATKLAITNCKQEILKNDPKAFRTPPRKDFHLQHINESIIDPELDSLENYLNCLPALHRFLVVLSLVLNMPASRISGFVGMESSIVEKALENEMDNLSRIYRCVKAAGGKCAAPTAELLKSEFRAAVSKELVPTEVEEMVVAYIIEISEPIKKRTQTQQSRIAFTGGILLVCALALVTVLSSADTTTSEDTANATTDSTLSTSQKETQDTSEATEYTEPFHINASKATEITEDVPKSEEQEATSCTAQIDIKDYGTITVSLDKDAAPATVENFISLAESGFYDGLTFHRIIKGFMMQGGDPNGDGTGGSEKTIAGEFSDNGFDNSLSHTRGAISMARSSDYNSASSQFFIVHKDSTYLDGQYAVFGYVTEGLDVVDAICNAAEPTDTNGSIAPEKQPVIQSITILINE